MDDRNGVWLGLDLSVRGEGVMVLASAAGAALDVRSGLGGVASAVGALRELVGQAGPRLKGVCAARGPGSYVGVRSALALAIGLAQARQLPLRLVGSLAVVADTVDPSGGELLVVVAAGRGGLYLQRFRSAGATPDRHWQALGPAVTDRGPSFPAELLAGADHLLDPMDAAPQVRLPRAHPVRSGAEALARLGMRAEPTSSSYDLVSADYGARQGGAP